VIPCYICGRDAGTGWIIGFPPAPDSQKMALCREHDLPLNREEVQRAWQELIYNQLDWLGKNEAARQGGEEWLLSLYFTGGGALSLPCVSIDLTDSGTLKITTPERDLVFFPLSQVRNYALTPLGSLAESCRDTPEPAASEGGDSSSSR
jgi:hypothetical protein